MICVELIINWITTQQHMQIMKQIIKSDFYLYVIQTLIFFLYWYENSQICDYYFDWLLYNTQIVINQINIKCQIFIFFFFENFSDNLSTNFSHYFSYFLYGQVIYSWLSYRSVLILIFRSFVCNSFIWFVIKIVFHVFFNIIFFVWCF